MSYLSKGKINIIVAAVLVIIAIVVFAAVAEAEDKWTYIFDEDAQKEAEIMTWMAWICIAAAVEQLISAAVNFTKVSVESGRDVPPSSGTHLPSGSRPSWEEQVDPSQLVECIFCGQKTDKNSTLCKHCGRRRD